MIATDCAMTNTLSPITQAQRDALHARGLTDDDIRYIPPEEVDQIIRNILPEDGQKILNGGDGATVENDPSDPALAGETTERKRYPRGRAEALRDAPQSRNGVAR